RPTRTSSSLRGVVSDLAGAPLPGAVVAVEGVGSIAAGAGGTYAFAELGGLQFNVTVSASGYATRTYRLGVQQPGDLVQDFKLPSLATPYLSIADLALANPSAGLASDVVGTAVVSNPGGADASGLAGAVIVNGDGKRIGMAAALDSAGNPMSTVTLAPGQQQVVRFKWNTGSHAPGNYQFTARLHVPGSATREDPDGVVLGSLQQPFAIVAGAGFIGSVTANPPVLRAGTNTAVKLSALLQNSGNVALPAQDYRLTVVDTKTGQPAHAQSLGGAELPVGQLRPLAFADWTPTVGGNFRIEVAAPSTPGALVTTTLYVGDSGAATFTVDRSIVPAGDQKVRGTIKVSGQSVADGTINDPLVPLVKAALVKAVNYADNYAVNHYVTDLKCFACHVQTQAVVGGERSLRYTAPVSALRRAVLMSGITQNMTNDTANSMTSPGLSTDAGPVQYSDWPTGYWITNTTLGMWAATQWHDPAAVNYSKVRMANYLMKVQSSDGSWYPDHVSAWWRSQSPMVGLNVGSLASLRDVLRSQPAPAGKTFVPFVVPGLPGGDKRVAQGPDGTLYIHLYEGALYALSPAGVLTPIHTGQAVRSVKVLDGGKLLIASGNGVHVRQADGTMQLLWTVNAYDAQPMADGNYLVTLWGGGGLYKLTPTGAASLIVSDSRLAGSSMNTTIMPDGSIVAHSYWGNVALRFSPAGQLLDLPIPNYPAGRPMMSNGYRGGFVLGMESGLYFYNKDWVAERWSNERIFSSTTLADGRLLVSYAGGLYFADDQPVNVNDVLARVDTSVNRAVGWLKTQSTTEANNLDLAFRLIGLGHARKYFQGTARSTEFDTLITAYAATLRGRQRADGGWVWSEGSYGTSDSMVTAMVGIALDTLNPSPNSPEVRKAVQLLLSRQSADGAWASENGISYVPLIPSTWVEIWLPIMLERLGGIDTDVNLTLPGNIALSNPDRAPTASATNPDGSSAYSWKLLGVTESSQDLNFDLTLRGMQVDEVRPAAQDAHLVFRNTFVDGSVTAPIPVPKVSVGTSLTHTVATDRPTYTEADQAVFTSPITNGGTAPRDAFVRMTVLDASGQVVEVLPLGATVSVPASGSVPVSAGWSVRGVLAGSYQLKAELISPAGLGYGTATTSFTVMASQPQSALARIGADRASYAATQTVQLAARVSNASANTPYENVLARTTVSNATGATVFTRSEAISQLAPVTSRAYAYGVPASGLAVGSYTARLELVDQAGTVLAQSTASFAVLGADVTGAGLSGQLQAAPSSVFVGQGTVFTLQANNGSSTPLANVPITVRLVDPVGNNVVATFTGALADWQPGQARTLQFPWTA
ncbi:MAG TPA: carboxypeptidase regulatory-like domain-containing protein, partial [Ramlibacter sp.]